jgi:ribA/ribD-fused uncharacterized protein
MQPIKFFGSKQSQKWWRFSNFAPLPIVVDNVRYLTSEHYFQAAKFLNSDSEYAETIRDAKTPLEAKRLGKSRKHPIDPRWDKEMSNGRLFKDLIMMKALRAKADQHPEFVADLLSTEDAEIIENSPYDSYWGSGKSGGGKNMLGKLLMELRGELISTSSVDNVEKKQSHKGDDMKDLQCVATTKKGSRCLKKRKDGLEYCSIHNPH